MTFDWTITLGQALTIAVPLVAAVGGLVMTRIMQRTKTAVIEELNTKLDAHAEKGDEKLADTNRRVSDLAAGTVQTSTELREFKEHVARHFVERDELGELRESVDKSIDRMQASLDIAIATMGDVRDSVIVLTARGGKASVPPARRRAAKPGDAL